MWNMLNIKTKDAERNQNDDGRKPLYSTDDPQLEFLLPWLSCIDALQQTLHGIVQ